jgi:DNA repair exonuclease SbcCD nuclease subunit
VSTENVKRAWLITDLHFGVRSSSVEWIEIQKDYFYDFLIPILEKEKNEDDALFILGDVFDSRQSLNILVMNEALLIMKKLSEILPIYIIIGNHDIYRKFSNDINSLEIFKILGNVHIIKEAKQLKFADGVTGLFMPWQDTHEQEMAVIREDDSKYLFCHTDIAGFKYNRRVAMLGGIDPGTMEKYKKVYTGHVHLAQNRDNIRVVGSPYQLTRGDMGNIKSLWMINLADGKETQFINDSSPKFIRIHLEKLFDQTLETLQDKFGNNFVDILVSDKWATTFPFGRLTEAFHDYRKINFILTGNAEFEESAQEHRDINLSDLIVMYIENLSYNKKIKSKLTEKSMEFYNRAQKILDEKNTME